MKDEEFLKNKVVRQGNAVTNAHYRMSLLEKNIFLCVLGELNEEDDPNTVYEIDTVQLKKLSKTQTSVDKYRDATRKLLQRVLEVKEIEERKGKKVKTVLQVSLISHARYIIGKGRIEIGLSPQIRPYLFDLKKNFTQYSLTYALQFKSIYSKRIYELLSQWYDIGMKSYPLQDLRYILGLTPGLIDSKSQKKEKEKFEKHSDFDRYVIQAAQKEINSISNINFTYSYRKKSGRSFTHIDFLIERDPSNQQAQMFLSDSPLYDSLRSKYGLSPALSRDIIAKLPPEEINQLCYQIQLAKANNVIKTNIGAYAAGVFRNVLETKSTELAEKAI